MKEFLCFVLIFSVLLFSVSEASNKTNLAALSFTAAYTGDRLSDAFSSIFYAGNGVVLAGKRSNTAGHRIFRSTDHGHTWAPTPEPDGYSGKHVYFFGMNNQTNVIITGTGDTGTPCLMRSTDMGQTWTVILNSDQATQLGGCDPKAIFSPMWIDGKHWIACLRTTAKGYSHIIESYDDGDTWSSVKTSGLYAGCRRMIRTSLGHILCGGVFVDSGTTPGLYLSKDNGVTWYKMIDNVYAFAGMEELPNGIYLSGTVNFVSDVPTNIASSSRSNNRVTITMKQDLVGIQDGDCVGIASMSDPSMNVHPCAVIKLLDSKTFTYENEGPDVGQQTEPHGVILPYVPVDMYRSSDAGATWKKVATLPAYSLMNYVREIRYLGNGLVYAFVAANENGWDDRSLQVYRSDDFGITWTVVDDDIYVGQYGRLNAVYQTALTDTNTLVAATQPDSDIIIHEGPFQ